MNLDFRFVTCGVAAQHQCYLELSVFNGKFPAMGCMVVVGWQRGGAGAGYSHPRSQVCRTLRYLPEHRFQVAD